MNILKKREYDKNYYLKNKEKIDKRHKEYAKTHKEEAKRYREEHKKEWTEYHKNYQKEYYQLNKNKIDKRHKEYNLEHKKELVEYHKQHQKRYRKSHINQIRINENNRIKIDINFKLTKYLRNRLYLALKNNQKTGHTLELLGCSIKFLKEHLEKEFREGMNWNNWGVGEGKWNIDHIRPCASFDLSKASEQKKCFHYTNLQPLWARENYSKNNKIL